jgi:hypothetical protein
MIQQGGFNACLELCKEGTPDKTRMRAVHAVAKVPCPSKPITISVKLDHALRPHFMI